MPTYEYKCMDCGEHFDIFASISEKQKSLNIACPKCGSKNVKEVFGSMVLLRSQSSSPPRSRGGCCPFGANN